MTKTLIAKMLECLAELSNKNFQLGAWLKNSEGCQSSLVEATEGLYGDSGYDFFYEKDGKVFTREIDTKLEELFNSIKNVDSMRPAREIIDSPEMEIVRSKASNILTLLTREHLQ